MKERPIILSSVFSPSRWIKVSHFSLPPDAERLKKLPYRVLLLLLNAFDEHEGDFGDADTDEGKFTYLDWCERRQWVESEIESRERKATLKSQMGIPE